MTEPKFTKRPWHTIGCKVVDKDGFTVAKCGYTLDKTEEEAEANAVLMAAAPEMYDELAEVGAVINEFLYAKGDDRAVLRNDLKESVGKIETLLAKARGEEEG